MKRAHYFNVFSFITFFNLMSTIGIAQSKEKIVFNEAVEHYKNNEYKTAQEKFESLATQNPKALYNAGNAAYLSGNYEQAKNHFSNFIQLESSPISKAKGYYNLGNINLQEALMKETESGEVSKSNLTNAINAYKESLKLNPNDLDTKYNLTYALKKLQNQQQNNEDQNNKDQNNQQNKDDKQEGDKQQNEKKDGDSNKDGESKKDDSKSDNKGNDKGDNKDGDKEEKPNNPKPGESSKSQALKDLDAINNDEKKILQKVIGSKATQSNEAKLEKDW